MFERLNTPQEHFHVKLGAALTMEPNVREMLGKLEEEAQRQPLKEQFRHHADETRQQIQNIEKAFHALGEEPDDSPCPAIQGPDKEDKAKLGRQLVRPVSTPPPSVRQTTSLERMCFRASLTIEFEPPPECTECRRQGGRSNSAVWVRSA